MTDTLTPGVPAATADLFADGTVTWEPGWGDRDTHTCLHGALLRPCAEPGDEIMWSILLAHRGLTIEWNDEQTSAVPVIEALRRQADPDEAEMVVVFGPNWRAARSICRTWATATPEQRRAAWDARAAAWDAWAAWDARDAAWDAWDARAARDAAWDAWDAWAARAAAWDAFLATIAQPWITPRADWDQAAHDRLIAPWVSVFGPIEAQAVTS